MRAKSLFTFVGLTLFAGVVYADPILYTYEGDVLPYDVSAGWEVFNPCESPCAESIEGGSFVLRWPVAGDLAVYTYRIAEPGETTPDSLWAEWRFASNHPVPPHSYTCDANFTADFREVFETVALHGDAVFSFNGDDFVLDLELGAFHTLRFESPDGVAFRLPLMHQTTCTLTTSQLLSPAVRFPKLFRRVAVITTVLRQWKSCWINR